MKSLPFGKPGMLSYRLYGAGGSGRFAGNVGGRYFTYDNTNYTYYYNARSHNTNYTFYYNARGHSTNRNQSDSRTSRGRPGSVSTPKVECGSFERL